MKTTKIQFNGRSYYSRIVNLSMANCLSVRQSCSMPCSPAVSMTRTKVFASKEAERIYDEIFFFTDENASASENELIAELKSDNPDWFE